jgi:polar amino acid transport system substrate-binding protein
MVAHPNALLVGEDFRGRADVTGKAFGHEILARALANGRGPVDCAHVQPGQMNLYHMATSHRLVGGSDGKRFVVCTGNYRRCAEGPTLRSSRSGLGAAAAQP